MRRFFGPTGSVSRITIESRALENNLLGDPSLRIVDIYLPAGHDGRGLPLLVDLVGFTGSGLAHTNWVGFRSIAGGEPNGTRSRAAFLRVSPADELIALWPRTSVSAEIFALAAHLAERMNYFGRAESLACARAEHDVDREARINCRPGSEAAEGSVSVEVLAPLSPQAYAAMRRAAVDPERRVLDQLRRHNRRDADRHDLVVVAMQSIGSLRSVVVALQA